MTEIERLTLLLNKYYDAMLEQSKIVQSTRDSKKMLEASTKMKEYAHLLKEVSVPLAQEKQRVRQEKAATLEQSWVNKYTQLEAAYQSLEHKYYDLVTYIAERELI